MSAQAEEPQEHLFNTGSFRLHSGGSSSFRIECDALTDEDLAAIAEQIAARFHWAQALGIGRGGARFCDHVSKYNLYNVELPVLIVDDVWTTGRSMQEARDLVGDELTIGVVIFARSPTPEWVHPIFRLWDPIA